MAAPPPIFTAPLFHEISRHLVQLLRSLDPAEWHVPTVSSGRKVKDIAAHLLDGSLRRLSIQRDGYSLPDDSSRSQPAASIIDFLNRLNTEWESATRRLSPLVLVDLIEWADTQLSELFEALDPFAPAVFPVAWAGDRESRNWMDVAREYTEKWHHTQQIFDATGRPSTITDRRLFHPCLETFLRALPFTYRNVDAVDGTVVCVRITGDAGGDWFLVRDGFAWRQSVDRVEPPAAQFVIGQESAWKLFTKRLDRDTALSRFPDIRIEGDFSLGSHVIDMVSVMA